MQHTVNLGLILKNIDEFKYIISDIEKLKIIVQSYFDGIDIPNEPSWIQYKDERGLKGSVSITSLLYKDPTYLRITKNIAEILNDIGIIKNYKFKSTRVNFIQTQGMVGAHQDTGKRKCAINIGLSNSNIATTRFSLDNCLDNFDSVYESLIVEDGYGYLINTQTYHAVYHSKNLPRYLISYGFEQPFDEIKSKLSI